MDNFDQVVGTNVAIVRGARQMSQADLANAMTDRGHPFHQQTVTKIEKGARAVRLEEALALADALGVPMQSLWSGKSPESDGARLLLGAKNAVYLRYQALDRAVREFDQAAKQLQQLIDTHGHAVDSNILASAQEWAGDDPMPTLGRPATGRERHSLLRDTLEHLIKEVEGGQHQAEA